MATVHLEHRDTLAIITVSYEPVKGALTIDMARELGQICQETEADQSFGCAAIRGIADTFCSGADTRSWSDTYGDVLSDRTHEEIDLMYGSFVRFGGLPVPTIAAVRGDPPLARRVKRTFEIETPSQVVSRPAAWQAERGVQLWTQRRRLNAKKVPS